MTEMKATITLIMADAIVGKTVMWGKELKKNKYLHEKELKVMELKIKQYDTGITSAS